MSFFWMVVAFALLSCTPLRAQEVFKSNCYSENPKTQRTRTALAPCLAELDKKITEQSEYKDVSLALKKTLGENVTVVCWLTIKANGDFEKLTISETTSDSLSESILALVRNAGPINSPPVDLVYPQHIVVRFQKINGQVEVSTALCNRLINERIGASVSSHCGFKRNIWLDPFRTKILQSCGVLKANADGTNSYVYAHPKLVEKPVTCKLQVKSSGQIEILEICRSSGDSAIDQTALKIIRKAAPFKPDSAAGKPFKVHFSDSDVTVTPLLNQ